MCVDGLRRLRRLGLEFSRVLKPGGSVGVFDLMRTSDGELPYPMPWSSVAESSFVCTADEYKAAMAGAGLAVQSEDNRREALMEMLAKQLAGTGVAGAAPPPTNPLTLGILMGATFPQKGQNAMSTVKAGVIAPILITATR